MPNRETTGTGGPNPTGSTIGSSTIGSSNVGSSNIGGSTTGSSTGTSTGNSLSGGRGNVEDVKKTVNRAADEAANTGREALDQAQGRIRSLLEQQTGRAADQLGGVANALHKAAEQLNAENGGVVADYAEQAAGRVERVADMLRDATVDDIVGEVEGFARRQPEVFIGAAFAVGFLAARFIKSSGERRMHRASTSLRSGAHPSQSVRSTRGTGRDTDRDFGRTPSRGMAGGIAESASRGTPSHSADIPSTGSLSDRLDSDRPGEPRPAAGRIGMPLSSAPASATGRTATPSADTALGTSTVSTAAGVTGTTGSAGSAANAGTTGVGGAGISGTPGGTAGTSSTSKPQGQRP